MTAAIRNPLDELVEPPAPPSQFFAALAAVDAQLVEADLLRVENAKLRLRISDLTGECVRCSSTHDVLPFLQTRLCRHCLEHGTIGDLHPTILGLHR